MLGLFMLNEEDGSITEPRVAQCGSEVGLYQFQFEEAPLTRCNAHTHGEKCPQCDEKVWERFLESPTS